MCSPRAWATTLTSDLVNKLENVVTYAEPQSTQCSKQTVRNMKNKLEVCFAPYLQKLAGLLIHLQAIFQKIPK